MISASMVKDLREATGAGMLDCKKALEASNGNMEEAITWLREKGISKAAKKASRIAAEGLAVAKVDGNRAVVVEVNSETDFVAKNEKFINFVNAVAEQALEADSEDMDAFLASAWKADASKTVNDALVEQVAVIGEKLSIRRIKKVTADNGVVVSYVHGGGRIGVLLSAETETVNDTVKEALSNIAMQIAALNPKYTNRDEVDQEYIEHEKEILKAQAIKEKPDAPEKIIDGMVMGRINKELKEVCLLDQVYVKAEDGKQSVGKYVESVAKAEGISLEIKGFVRYETGEGIEKVESDFAAEVAAQLK